MLVGHDGKGIGSGWYLQEVVVSVASKEEIYCFSCRKWLDTKEDDGLIERELFPVERKKSVLSNSLAVEKSWYILIS